MTTLTIELDDDSMARVRELATARNVPVSEMVRRLVQVVTRFPKGEEDLPPITRQALGMLSPMTDEEVEQALDEYRMRKYGDE